MKIETRKIKEYPRYTLYGKYKITEENKDGMLLYRFCESTIKDGLSKKNQWM